MIEIKDGVYRYDTKNINVLFSKEDGLNINYINKENYIESLYELEDILKEIIKLENKK